MYNAVDDNHEYIRDVEECTILRYNKRTACLELAANEGDLEKLIVNHSESDMARLTIEDELYVQIDGVRTIKSMESRGTGSRKG